MQAVYQFIEKGQEMQVKVCGITENRNMRDVANLGPDLLGFIFYGPSPRDVSNKIGQLEINLLSRSIKKVAVLVNETMDRAVEIVQKYGFDVVQLHGEESPEYCSAMKDWCEVVKCFPVAQALPLAITDYDGSCNMYLFDTATAGKGGSGEKFNHHLLHEYRGATPFLIGGGIAPGDADTMKQMEGSIKLFSGVDLNSRFEVKPGVKDLVLLSNFMQELQR